MCGSWELSLRNFKHSRQDSRSDQLGQSNIDTFAASTLPMLYAQLIQHLALDLIRGPNPAFSVWLACGNFA